AAAGTAHLVYLHTPQAGPEALPRSLLRALLSVLTHGRRDQLQLTPLFEMARAGMREAASNANQIGLAELERRYRLWLNHLGPAVGDPQVWEVVFALFRCAVRGRLAREDGRRAS